ncbi:hypothetical protein HK104_003924 [Borealophlyctis nickersoniae]|nr:hypothetical protein HK104_003924 [Borealophlyctis nickersoniae]
MGHDAHHEEEYNEPGGFKHGEAPGRKRWFYWEPWWYFGLYGGSAVFFINFLMRDDLPHDRRMVEAQTRLMERGQTFSWPFPPDYKRKEVGQEHRPYRKDAYYPLSKFDDDSKRQVMSKYWFKEDMFGEAFMVEYEKQQENVKKQRPPLNAFYQKPYIDPVTEKPYADADTAPAAEE